MRFSMRLCALAFFGFSALALQVGCGAYTIQESRVTPLPKGAKIAVAVWEPHFDNSAAIHGTTAVLSGYLTTALIQEGFDVRVLRPEFITGRELWRHLADKKAFSTRKSLARGLEAGGEIEADAAFLSKLLENTELSDIATRMPILARIGPQIRAEFGVDYMLVVHRFDTFGYATYAVELKSRRVINSMVVSGDRKGFKKALAGPYGGDSNRARDGDVTRLDFLRLATHIARKL